MIAFRAFSKRFGVQAAVSALTLDVAAGEVVALLGPNGSGKTTSIKAAAGLIRPSSGAVAIGHPGWSALDTRARALCAFLPQKVGFPELMTGREIVSFYAALRARPSAVVDAALAVAALNGASRRLVGTYSGGMTQRLGLAVAIAAGAPVLLLDEPTAALDPDGLAAFYAVIEQHRRDGRTVLFSSHQMGDVERLADRFAVLVHGRLVAMLSAAEFADRLADRGVMQVTLDRPVSGVLSAVRDIAPNAAMRDTELTVPGPARIRPAALDRARAAGATVVGFTVQEGRLDALYRDLVEEAQ